MTTQRKRKPARHHQMTHSGRLKAALRPILRAIGTPMARHASRLLKNEQFNDLAGLKVDPSAYTDPSTYFWDAQVCALFNKNNALPTSIDKKQVAIEKFMAAEEKCATVNEYLSRVWYTPSADDVDTLLLLERAQRIVKRILGKCPPLDTLVGRFGPGSNDLVRSKHMRYEKYDKVSCTTRLHALLATFVGPVRTPFWDVSTATINDCEAITTVDKNSLTDRTIGITVSLNGFYQTALGRAMRDKLDRYRGVPIEHLQDVHGELCRIASNDISTIDLSMASDTVSWMLVRLLLPDDWFYLADTFRVGHFAHPLTGERTEYQKFSAMGNGFTFELETLLFYAICLAAGVPRDCVSTYGDDVICTEQFGQTCSTALQQCGFVINVNKTFLTGSFKESCGHDYFHGRDVRPHYLRDLRSVHDLVKFVNVIRRISLWESDGHYCSIRFHQAWLDSLQLIPRNEELHGPLDFGDDCIHASFEEASHVWPYRERRGGIRRYKTRRLMYKQMVLSPINQETALQQFLYERSTASSSPMLTKRASYSSWEPTYTNVISIADPLISSEQELRKCGRIQRVDVVLTDCTYLPPWL